MGNQTQHPIQRGTNRDVLLSTADFVLLMREERRKHWQQMQRNRQGPNGYPGGTQEGQSCNQG